MRLSGGGVIQGVSFVIDTQPGWRRIDTMSKI